MKTRVKNYLSVTKKEWNVMVVLVVIIVLILAAPYVYQKFHKDNTINLKDFDKAVALLRQARDTSIGYSDDVNDNGAKPVHTVLFRFNPNNLSLTQWEQLGLTGHQASIIKHYEAGGGHFYKKDDLKKIYGLTADDYQRLEPYITIDADPYVAHKAQPGVLIEINSADSARLTQIRGVGPAFAARIIAYRQRLGGFRTVEQLKEIYGIDSARYAEISSGVKVNTSRVTRININEVDFEGLRKFPYLTNKQTNAIIQYRKQHGNYKGIADMKNIVLLDENILRKIEPYLVFK